MMSSDLADSSDLAGSSILVAALWCGLALAWVGHTVIWIGMWNRLHGTAFPMWMIHVLDCATKLGCLGLPLVFLVDAALFLDLFHYPFALTDGLAAETERGFLPTGRLLAWTLYGTLSASAAVIVVPIAVVRRRRRKCVSQLTRIEHRICQLDVARDESWRQAGLLTRALLSLPGNQAFEVELNEKAIALPRLPAALDGLTVVHLSDLHFTGRMSRSFFTAAVAEVNAMDADIIAITGDIVDRPECISWIPATLGQLRARHGVFAILGNHDCKVDLHQLRRGLQRIGVLHLGGRWLRLTVDGAHLLLAGNELPWITPTTDMRECPSRDDLPHLRLLLAHTPDVIAWARRYDFDLMLAGHTHGGQFCLPGFGPVVCPSRLPLDFASGTIFADPTVLHVSRGLSSEVPLRLNCRPEISRITLRCAQPTPEPQHVDVRGNELHRTASGVPAAANAPRDEVSLPRDLAGVAHESLDQAGHTPFAELELPSGPR